MAPSSPRLRAKRTLWQCFALVLITVGLYDGGVLTFGPAHYFSSPSYAAIRAIGLRPVGVVLLAISCSFLYFLRSGERRPLFVVCCAGFGFNVFWLCALLYSWGTAGIVGLTGPAPAAAFAATYAILAARIDERRGN